jgi:hypothetical protein
MPLTYSIAYGLIAGIGIWIILQTVFWILGFVGIERPEFTEDDIPKGGMSKVEDEKAVDSNDNSLEKQQVEEAPANSPVAPVTMERKRKWRLKNLAHLSWNGISTQE